MLWEQTALPLAAARLRLDVMLNPGFTAPILCPCPQVTVFHDLQHKRHPEYFRWFDLPFWRVLSVLVGARLRAWCWPTPSATAADLRRYYRLPESKMRVAPLGVDPVFFDLARRRRPEDLCGSVDNAVADSGGGREMPVGGTYGIRQRAGPRSHPCPRPRRCRSVTRRGSR